MKWHTTRNHPNNRVLALDQNRRVIPQRAGHPGRELRRARHAAAPAGHRSELGAGGRQPKLSATSCSEAGTSLLQRGPTLGCLTYAGETARAGALTILVATSAKIPSTIPDTSPMIGPMSAIMSRGCVGIGMELIIAASRA